MADLRYPEDPLLEAQERQEEIFSTDPMGPAQLDVTPQEELGYGSVETPDGEQLTAEDFNTGQDFSRPAPEEDVADLPFGEYDPEDIRIQVVRNRYGRPDGNYYEFVRSRHQSGSNPPTGREINEEAVRAAQMAYAEVYGRMPQRNTIPEMQELIVSFEQLYREQEQLMSQQGSLTPAEEATNPGNSTAGRAQALLKDVGVEPETTYLHYERRLMNNGRLPEGLTDRERDQRIIDAVMADMKTLGMEPADQMRLRNRLENGDWEGFRGTGEGPQATPAQIAEGQEWLAQVPEPEPTAEDEAPSLLRRLFSEDTPTGIDRTAGQRAENPWAAATQRANEFGPALPLPEIGPVYTTALQAARGEGFTGEDARDAVRRVGQGFIEVAIASALEGGALAARGIEDLIEGERLDPDAIRPRINYLQDEIQRYDELAENADLRPEAAARRDRLRAELAGLRPIHREALDQIPTPIRNRAAAQRAQEVRGWYTDTFGVPIPENDDALWAQAASGLGSAGGFMSLMALGGLGGGAMRLFTGAMAGAASGGAGAYREAIQRGASEEEAVTSAGWMALVSVSEIAPLERMIRRLPIPVDAQDEVERRLANYLGNMVVGGGEEALQEGFQSVMGNIVAQNVYNFETDTWEGVTDDMTVGAIVGMIIPGALGVPGLVRGPADGAPPADVDPLLEAQDQVAEALGQPVTDEDRAVAEAAVDAVVSDAEAQLAEEPAPIDPEQASAAVAAILQVTDGGAAVVEDRLISDAPEGGVVDPAELVSQVDAVLQGAEPATTEQIVAQAARTSPLRSEVRTMALDTPDVTEQTVDRVEAAAGSVVPTQEEVAQAQATIRDVEELQARVDRGIEVLSREDRQALATVTQSARAIVGNATRAVFEAREAVSAALGADVAVLPDAAPVQRTGPASQTALRAIRERQERNRARNAQRRQERQAENAMAKLRSMGQNDAVAEASIAGILAPLPRTVFFGETDSNAQAIGVPSLQQRLHMPTSEADPSTLLSTLRNVRERLTSYQGMLQQTVTAVTPEGARSEPMRQLMLDRAFRGRDAALLGEVSLPALASADERQLNVWATATRDADVSGLVSAAFLSAGEPSGPGASPNLEMVRRMARATLDARLAERKTRRAIEQVDRAIMAVSAVSDIGMNGSTDMAAFVRSLRQSESQGITDGVALRQALRDHAPSLLEDGIMPVRELARVVGQANAAMPQDLRAERGPLAEAWQNQLTVEELFGENWQARRLSRRIDQAAALRTVESVLSLTPDSDPVAIQQAREELGAMAVAERILLGDQLPALRAAYENAMTPREENRLLDLMAEAEPLSDEQYAEQMMNEFGLDEDAAVGTVLRGREMAAAAKGDPEAIRSVNEGADELVDAIRFYEGDLRDSRFEGVDPSGETIQDFPLQVTEDFDVEAERLQNTPTNAAGVRHLPGFGLGQVSGYIGTLARRLGYARGITVLPYTNFDAMEFNLGSVVPAADSAFMAQVGRSISRRVRNGHEPLGTATRSERGAVIVLNTDAGLSDGELAAVAAHELGHVVMGNMIEDTLRRSPKTLDMLYRAYEGSGYGITPRTAGHWPLTAADADLTQLRSSADYQNQFSEWFASRVGEQIVTQGTSAPTGLVPRLMQRIADMWRTLLASLRGDYDSLGRIAISRMVEEATRRGLSSHFVADWTPDFAARMGVPERQPSAAQEQLMDQPGETPADVTWSDMAASQPMTQESLQTPLRQHYAGLTADAGVTIRVINPERIGVADKAVLRGRGVGYHGPRQPGAASTIVVDPSRYRSMAQAVKDVDLLLATQHGLNAALGTGAVTRLHSLILNPDHRGLSGAVSRQLRKLRNVARRDLTVDGVPPSDMDVVEHVLGRIVEDFDDGNGDAAQISTDALRLALEQGGRVPLDLAHLAQIMRANRSAAPRNVTPGLTRTAANAVPRVFEAARAQVESRGERQRRGATSRREVLERSRASRIYDALFDYMLPVTRIGRVAASIGGEAGERAATWARQLVWRSKMYQSEFNRVVTTQSEVHSNLDANMDAMAAALGYTDRRELRAHINVVMMARATIERNENTALVYGRLDDETLETARLNTVAEADEAVQTVQGDNRRRTAESFVQVREIRNEMMAKLRALILDPNAPDSPVRRQIRASREGRSPFSNEPWADSGGATTQMAMALINSLEQRFNGKWMQAFRDSGMDGRLRRLLDQTYENRVMSGIYGASGELYISRLALNHYTPMRGMGVQEGVVRHESEGFDLAEHDLGFMVSGTRAPGTRLVPDGDLRRYSNSFKINDVMDRAAEDYFTSIREMTVNHQTGALVGLALSLDDLGVAADETDPRQRPITVSRELPFLLWADTQTGELHETGAPGRMRVINPQITQVRNTVDDTGRTGSLLHALPNGNYQVIRVNDPGIYQAMTFRFQRGTANPAADAILRTLGEITRINARTFTSWSLPFTTFRAFTRDLQENADLLLFERGLPAAQAATLPARAARLIIPMERFFQSGSERQDELIREWLAKRSHPMNGFARRWRAGAVQVFAQNLELATDRAPASPLGAAISGAAGVATNMLKWAEAHADAMENSVRQATSDLLERHLISQGMDPQAAAAQAYDDVINVLNFGQRSAVGEALAPVQTFAQTALTGTHALLSRRLWRGGEAPNFGGTVTDEGRLLENTFDPSNAEHWRLLHQSLNYPRLGAWAALGFLNTMFASFALGLWTGEGEDDELDDRARKQIGLIRDTVFGPDPDVVERSWLLRGMDRGLRALLDDPDAEADDLRVLRPTTVFSSILLPYQTEDEQARIPVAYGITSLGLNVGQAAALIALGHKPEDVGGALLNAGLRNLTPLEAPYGEQPPAGVSGLFQLLVPSIMQTGMELFMGETLDGIRTSAGGITEAQVAAEGPSAVPGMTGATLLNEALVDVQMAVQQTGNDLGIPFVAAFAERLIPSGRRAETMLDYVPLVGAIAGDAFREAEKQMTNNGAAGKPLFGLNDALAVATRTVLEDGGFISMDPGRSDQNAFYRAATWKGWDKLANYGRQQDRLAPTGRVYENQDYEGYRKAAASLVSRVNQEIGVRKAEHTQATRAMTRADTMQERADAAAEAYRVETGMKAVFREAARALETMQETVSTHAPNIVPAAP